MSIFRRTQPSWPLSVRARDAFSAQIRHRGEAYYTGGKLGTPAVVGECATVKVQGTDIYTVQFNWELAQKYSVVRASCDCPYYADHFLCKHCWAVILKLDEAKIGRTIQGGEQLRVRHDLDSKDLPERTGDASRSPGFRETPIRYNPWYRQLIALQSSATRASKAKALAPGVMPSSVNQNARIGHYVLDLKLTGSQERFAVWFYHQEILSTGEKAAIQRKPVIREDIKLYTDSIDREIMLNLLGEVITYSNSYGNYNSGYSPPSVQTGYIPWKNEEYILKALVSTGRFYLCREIPDKGFGIIGSENGPAVLSFDEGQPWHFLLKVSKKETEFYLDGFLVRGDERIAVSEPELFMRSGFVVFRDRIARLDADQYFNWLIKLREKEIPPIPEADADDFVKLLCSSPNLPQIEWANELGWAMERRVGEPVVVFNSSSSSGQTKYLVLADLRFDYGSQVVSISDMTSTFMDSESRRLILRDSDKEMDALKKLGQIPGFDIVPPEHGSKFQLRTWPVHLPKIVAEIISWGWKVEAYGKPVRSGGKFDIKVSSGVDWFDLNGNVQFTEKVALGLPALLSSLARGEYLIPLGDGTLGMLPVEWLKKYAPLASLGEATEEGFRFNRPQGALLSAWLSYENTVVSVDHDFSKLMKEIASQEALKPSEPASSFHGSLRSYQKDGLAWLKFLGNIGFGGILADDMGLGKTVQLLAHLDSEYQKIPQKNPKTKQLPSLIILPKSLMWNWKEEAERFTPSLNVISYAGSDRKKLLKDIPGAHLVLITYSTLRLDFEQFREFEFYFVVADEAQAIKNADSLAHKVCCLIRGRHRLAMTGTPVENSVEDLFSILDFVNPKLLGNAVRSKMTRASSSGLLEPEALKQLSQALKPFILRRTKEQVLKDLPEKTEKILHCEMSPKEMKYYIELRDYYRNYLKGEINRQGLNRSKIVVLEALLRLRQAACHPGLIDRKRLNGESAKVETLIAQLKEAISEGHKALVFSQFTSFMDILEISLRKEKIEFERLDGKTEMEDRKTRVARFQNDTSLKVFLISLKAGGVGLNLTAADYVFIMDPWWNPAVESQAIDRSHRIGQKNKVMAYRLICKDTVEEKIIELQKSKKDLADAIISADSSLLRKLTLEDIEILLS